MNRTRQHIADLQARMSQRSALLEDDGDTLCVPFEGGVGRLELRDEAGPRLIATFNLPPDGLPLAACLGFLDANLFAQCGGGVFALDAPGRVHLLRHILLDDLSDPDGLLQTVSRFIDEASRFGGAFRRGRHTDATSSASPSFGVPSNPL